MDIIWRGQRGTQMDGAMNYKIQWELTACLRVVGMHGTFVV